MDLHNNEVDRKIAEDNPYVSSPQLQEMILQAMRNGSLVVLDNNNTAYPSNWLSDSYWAR